ncbi:MAG TPA: hypothetical protein VF911_19375 [Thermoanaerobaculia bacterium]|jgi:hypothetical protein
MAAFAKDEVGRPSGGGSQIEWQLKINGHEKIVLTVVDKYGEAIVKEFGPGRNPAFRLTDIGGIAEDGQYNYELRVEPRIPAGLKKQLETARANEDDAAVRRIMKDAGLGDGVRQSGVITIYRNMIVSPDGTESTAKDKASADLPGDVSADAARPGDVAVQDQVIPDDLIVQASTCTGFDCVDGESFGFDTLRLKENNLRIHFDDTSASAGFPANDWRIIANESQSGGANMFAIEDSTAARNPFLIEAAAPANSIYLDSTGRIGFRQAVPLLDLHVTTGNTPALRLEQTNSGGFTAQTWDIGSNEANFFVRDLTSGSRLPFRIRPGAPTSSLDISSAGNVGIGTASPTTKMEIFTGANDSGLRVRGLTSAAQIGDIFVGNTGQLVLSTVAGTDSQGFLDLRSEDDIYGLILRSSNGVALFPWANFYVTDAADDYLTIDVNTGKVGDFTLTASGSVGIGTITPLSRLHVSGGDIRVTGGSFIDDGTTLNVPDYVFEDSYDLMSIPELAQFIRENKHLPNVPNVAEVKEKGVNLSQMQMRLLEKVEELTLHTIAQHETINTLEQKLKQQQEEFQKRLEALEARTKN